MADMSHRPSKHLRPARPLRAGHAQAEAKTDGIWVVRSIPAPQALKTYRCPGCNQTIPPGTPHTVAGPRDPAIASVSPVEDRRHWHTSCWNRRR
jgi:hypothetical protein